MAGGRMRVYYHYNIIYTIHGGDVRELVRPGANEKKIIDNYRNKSLSGGRCGQGNFRVYPNKYL